MNTRSMEKYGAGIAMLVFALAFAGNALSQERLETRSLPEPKVDRASCQNVNWHANLLSEYPWVVEACHEVILVDGQKWARFEADFDRMNRDGSFGSTFKGPQGRSRGSIDMMPGAEQRVLLDGRPTRFSDLRQGQTLNFYVPEGKFAFAAAPGAPEEQLATVVVVQERQPVQLAQAEPRRAQTATRLPATAGPLPILALGGMLSLLGGMVLTMRRRFSISRD